MDHHTHFPIANVQCQYDSPSDTEIECPGVSDTVPEVSAVVSDELLSSVVSSAMSGSVVARPIDDHNYDTRDEPPAFIIHHVNAALQVQSSSPARYEPRIAPKIMTIGPTGASSVNVIHVGDRPQVVCHTPPSEFSISKRIRRSEQVLRQAADCVSRGLTFQTVSEQFNIPISTIRFFMARKGILPRRRRGRTSQPVRTCNSPEPPFHMQHFKLPDMLAIQPDEEDNSSNT